MTTNYWEIGLKSFNAGDPATIGIQKIWDAMAPPASLSLLATIVGSLWADTYWAVTKMDKDRLALDIQAAIGMKPADSQKAAAYAFSSWYGLLVRGNLGDNGTIPKDDPVTSSPDVVVNGKAPLTVSQLIKQWNVYIYDPEPGLKNNTYGRAQSIGIEVPIKKPRLRMYYSDAGFAPPRTSWVKMFTFNGDKETSPLETLQGAKPVHPGERAASSESFAFTPPGSGHFCLISCAGSEFFDNNPSNDGGNWNTQEWVHYNGAAGWHNVDVPQSNSPTLKYYNEDGRPEHYSFEAHCRNLPEGSRVALVSESKRLQHRIMGGLRSTSQAYHLVTAEGEVPPTFVGELEVRFETPDGGNLPPGSSIDVRKFWHLAPGHPHYLQAVDQLGDTRALAEGRPVRIAMGNFTFVGPDE